MKEYLNNLSASKAALTVGIAFITSVILVTIVDDMLLANFVVPGDTDALARDIAADRMNFNYAVVGYLLVLVLDAIIGVAFYVVLKHASKKLAFVTAIFRLQYAFLLITSLLTLAFQFIDVYDYAILKLVGYVLFALHIFTLGYTVLKSELIPNSLGILLLIASFTYIIFFVDLQLPQAMNYVFMLIMALAELSLSIWLIVSRKKLVNG